jgi:nucleoside-diphosphate-sugar epimerase
MKRTSDLDGVALRYFFVYGPKQFAGSGYRSVIVKNFSRMIAGESPTIHGDGEQALDYIYIDDVVEATVRAMETHLPAAVYNVGSGRATTINSLTDRMLAVAGNTARKTHLPPDETAGSCRAASIERISRDLAWAPAISLDEGLRRTHAWLSSRAIP